MRMGQIGPQKKNGAKPLYWNPDRLLVRKLALFWEIVDSGTNEFIAKLISTFEHITRPYDGS